MVADILPPARYHARVTDMRPSATTVAYPARSKKPSTAPKGQAKKDEILTDWFEKGRASRGVPAAVQLEPLRKRTVSPLLIVVGALALTAVAYGISRVFATVHITIEPKHAEYTVNHEVVVSMNMTGQKSHIPGKLVTQTQTLETDVPATGLEKVSKKASGIILIYNAYSSQSQGLVANTRFEAPNGKIYRIASSVTVPGATLRDGKLVPSSIEVTVFADQPGSEYDSEPTDFTIPGFKGTPKFEGFYARAKTPMAGGFVGEATVVTQGDIDRAMKGLEQTLSDDIRTALKAQVPEGYVLPDSAYEIAVEKKEISARAGDVADSLHALLTMRVRAIGFRSEDMGSVLAQRFDLPPEAKLANAQDLSFAIVQRNIDAGTMTMRVSGNARFVWSIDEGALKSSLMSDAASPADFQNIFSTHDGIEKATVRFSPVWVRSIPRTSDAIIVEY